MCVPGYRCLFCNYDMYIIFLHPVWSLVHWIILIIVSYWNRIFSQFPSHKQQVVDFIVHTILICTGLYRPLCCPFSSYCTYIERHNFHSVCTYTWNHYNEKGNEMLLLKYNKQKSECWWNGAYRALPHYYICASFLSWGYIYTILRKSGQRLL